MRKAEIARYLQEINEIQSGILDELEGLNRKELRYSTDNARWNTVRRVMLRFGDHVREHTTQLIAAREDIGAAPTMPQRLLACAQEAYGRLLGAMVGLGDEHLDMVPAQGEWTPREILEHLIATQRLYLDLIRQARRAAKPVDKD